MKAYKGKDGKIRLFRPQENMARLNRSGNVLHFPAFSEDELLKVIKAVVKLDESWIPTGDQYGYSLYIRPNMIATSPSLGVSPPSDILLNVMMSPVGPYYKEGFKAVKLLADSSHVRAWPGGCGAYKISANYAPTVHIQAMAASQGYTQILWLTDEKITEVGTMNLFCLWKTPGGELELITAPLNGTILPGITRGSLLELTREWDLFRVVEREWTITELIKAIEENRVLEVFGAGTAAVVSPVSGFEYKGHFYDIPFDVNDDQSLYKKLWNHLNGIYYGDIPSPWSVVVE
eukprot:TRINITY_DN2063_c0_g1_i14.p1 TRINITY_DN2063_c0_g1~~TRINITY_DN2063_c0_g1_i14.p1  ORF type:complete len:290 (-),score=60.07 TRINITY_DN2063_c0_g1_i14:215-1084(-)